jgi:nitrate reductase cytochrome c-type subunit
MGHDVRDSDSLQSHDRRCVGVPRRRWAVIASALGLLVVGGVVTSCWLRADRRIEPDGAPSPAGGGDTKQGDPKQFVDGLLRNWPAGKNPDVALVLSGQQHSYLKFCGCSEVQLGGFERRYNFIKLLKDRGWPVVAADLGDLVTYTDGVHEQALLKYVTAMKALKTVDCAAIGLGEFDFRLPLTEGLSRSVLNNPDQFPKPLAANLLDRDINFPLDGTRSMIDDAIVVGSGRGGAPKVGITAVAGRNVVQALADAGVNLKFERNDVVLKAVVQKMDQAKADLKLLLYQGDHASALKVAQQMPTAFDVILCLSAEEEPTREPDLVGKTLIVRVGHKGRHVGLVGGYRTGNAAKPFELHYTLVEMGDKFETPEGQEKSNPVLRLLDDYALEVKTQKFLEHYPRVVHAVQSVPITQKAEFVGSGQCLACHQQEAKIWNDSKHSHALDNLAKNGKKPANRQFDPECVRCHTVGFGYVSGYVDEVKTPKLKDVGCENCHGPGSLHVQNPRDKRFFAALSPWKTPQAALLPPLEKLAKGRDALDANEQTIYMKVNDLCLKCHDMNNDPHYKLEGYWPKIAHGKNPAPAARAAVPGGGPPNR